MRKLFATVPATIVAAVLSLGQPALAAGPFDISGTLTGTTMVTSTRTADGNTFVDQTVAGPIGGSVTGTYSIDETVTIHPDGTYNVHGQLKCMPCTVNGASGSLTIRLDATSVPDGSFQGQFTVINGTGGLANLHGQGTFQGVPNVGSSYAGQVNFAP